MKNIKLKNIIKFLFLLLWKPCVIIGFGICFIWLIASDDKAGCLDQGKIYDPVQDICRDDCLTWDDKIGCVPITEENREKKAKGIPF